MPHSHRTTNSFCGPLFTTRRIGAFHKARPGRRSLYLYFVGVLICDVGPRDGLQNEDRVLDPKVRADLCDRLAAAGLKRIEAASFVNPKLVPQMAGAEDVMEALHRRPGTAYAGLVLNEKGYERAVAARVDEVHYALAATDEFGRRNQNASTDEGIETALTLVGRARADRLLITVTVSVAFGCPFEGPVPAKRVLEIVERLMAAPADEICLADTIGVGVPSQVKELVGGARRLGASVGAHFHNTRNTGYANAVAALDGGAVSLDASVGGAGGCPFAPKATGNIATEDLVYLLRGLGVDTGVDLEALIACSRWLGEQLGKELPGMVARAGDYPAN
jgi:isopropylmalate/homocitrate/citramalate synthase